MKAVNAGIKLIYPQDTARELQKEIRKMHEFYSHLDLETEELPNLKITPQEGNTNA